MKKLLILLILASISIVIIGCTDTISGPQVKVSPENFDFGEIKQSEGKVSTTFLVENIGGENLLVNRLSTSCGCTIAEIEKKEILPGEVVEMIVTFDPNTHPDDLGLLERVIYLQTNDPVREEVEIDITVTVIK